MKISIESSVTSCVRIVPVNSEFISYKGRRGDQIMNFSNDDSFVIPGNEPRKMMIHNTKPLKSQEPHGIPIDIIDPYRINVEKEEV